jgi:catechol 2,3-dioxygenase-like lactoylglutathione lyase family enzyme
VSSSLKTLGAVTPFVADLERSKRLYWDVFGLPVISAGRFSDRLRRDSLPC